MLGEIRDVAEDDPVMHEFAVAISDAMERLIELRAVARTVAKEAENERPAPVRLH